MAKHLKRVIQFLKDKWGCISRWTSGDAGPPHEPGTMTAQYIRLALFVLVTLLGVSIVRTRTLRDAWEPSISDYFHTQAQPALVAVMLGVGLCLVCLYSNDVLENFLLNFAGVCAPVVGLAATTQGTIDRVGFDRLETEVDGYADATVPAYFISLLVLSAFVAWVHSDKLKFRLRKAAFSALGVAAIWRAYVCLPDRDRHPAAAVAFFVPTIILVGYRAGKKGQQVKLPARVVLWILFGLMTVAAGWYGIYHVWLKRPDVLAPGDTFWIEVALIGGFGLFWLLEYLRIYQSNKPHPRATTA